MWCIVTGPVEYISGNRLGVKEDLNVNVSILSVQDYSRCYFCRYCFSLSKDL